jgi:hypothetical protein
MRISRLLQPDRAEEERKKPAGRPAGLSRFDVETNAFN